jgi:shikimate kinase
MKIILIGFMGSGKSTMAKKLSEILGLDWLDMDELVYQKTATRNMHEVFAKGGEPLLRSSEVTIAKELLLQENLILATGGGVVLSPMILDDFKKVGGKVVFLKASLDTIAKRLENDTTRPLLKTASSLKALYDLRAPLYLRHADIIVDVDHKSEIEIALQIQGEFCGL